MNWDINNLDTILRYINSELLNDRTMSDIERVEFNVNPRVIHKRLIRLGYKKRNNQYVKISSTSSIEVIQSKQLRNLRSSKIVHENYKSINNSTNIVQQNYENKINIEKILELQNLLEPLKELIEERKNKNNLVRDIKFKKIIDFKQRTIKCDKEVLKEWDKFVELYPQYKVQDLISQALREFINKYNMK